MLPLLAQSAPPAEALKEWLIVFGFLIGIGVGVKKLFFDKKAETPQPLVVKASDQWASKSELDQVHGRIKRERAEIDAAINNVRAEYRETSQRIDAELAALREQLAENNAAGEARAEKLHDRINAVLENSAEMRGELKSFIAAIRAR